MKLARRSNLGKPRPWSLILSPRLRLLPLRIVIQRENLLDAFGAAVQEVLRLHEQLFMAIVEGDNECNRFDLLIHMANEKKHAAKYAYIRHVESHDCSRH